MAETLFHDYIDKLSIVKDPGEITVAFDIGANAGAYSKSLAAKFDQVYAFEMNQANLHDVREATKDLKNVTVIPKAIGNMTGESIYYESAKNRGGHTISEAVAKEKKWGHTPDRFKKIAMVTIDDFVKEQNIDNLLLIKCDVEGAEDFIFNYGVETLKKFHPVILLETHATVNTKNLSQFFKSVGYTKFIHHKFTGVSELAINNHYIIRVE